MHPTDLYLFFLTVTPKYPSASINPDNQLLDWISLKSLSFSSDLIQEILNLKIY